MMTLAVLANETRFMQHAKTKGRIAGAARLCASLAALGLLTAGTAQWTNANFGINGPEALVGDYKLPLAMAANSLVILLQQILSHFAREGHVSSGVLAV